MWTIAPRLETRTEEFLRFAKFTDLICKHNESDALLRALRSLMSVTAEQNVKDPKDGELCMGKAKPGETLVEAWRDTDVQIVRKTCV